MSMSTRPGCPSQVDLDQYAEGLLKDEEYRRVAGHIEQCPHCQRCLAQIQENRVFMQEMKDVLSERPIGNSTMETVTLNQALPEQPSVDDADSPPQDATPPIPANRHQKQNRTTAQFPDIPNYDIIREINRGGQGVVFEAIQKSTGRTVAIKAMLSRHLLNDRLKWRFEQEVRLIAGIEHPNIVTVHDGGTEEGIHYYVMEYVNGQPLDTYVRLNSPSIREIIRLFVQVCEGVAVAHRHGVIHRDLKPSNILVNQSGIPQVLDFGLAKVVGQKSKTRMGQNVTEDGQVMGTLRYMSPEQTLGNPDAVDSSSDIYSLGVILYEILLGVTPYKTDLSDLYESLGNIREADPVRPSKIRSGLDRDLEAIVLKALEKESHRRYRSVAEFQSDLIAWLEGRAVIARSASSLYVLKKMAVRNKFQATVLVLLLISILSFAIIGMHGVLYGQQMAEERDRADTAHQNYVKTRVGSERAIQREMCMAWLLWHYASGDMDRAREICDLFVADGPERAIGEYLLDPGISDDELEETLKSTRHQPMMYFAIGERAFQQGDWQRARAAFQSCLKTEEVLSQKVWADRARSRLEQVDQKQAAASEK